ncbi:purine-nucleoside phosphorylase [Streptomyces sp. 3213]|uniref:purine-nucleoside phosphorylase n=1 Tax=Streptomyces sp. 3213.3 TaxID=1855348 RepID=UPI00089A5D38|nr:purine-nucleoside phosphorylase [Streptomyces sp. 3213.3]SEC67716.1 purine-nucleoside phosphorylase [Streptomyces sp. 3213] [Streptomyces sp. 3213.3]
MVTPHLSAAPGDFAPDVLMPGDPRRARRIAETILQDARLVTDVRGIEGYTGTYRGTPLSVLASGMGMPSATIYATELFRFYGVRSIVRVGTAGGIPASVGLRDVIVATAAHTDSAMSSRRIDGVHLSHTASFGLAAAAVRAAGTGEHIHIGPVFTTDHFYLERPLLFEQLEAHGTLAVEMEAAGLYATAAAEGGQALAVLTVSDHVRHAEALTPAERETDFDRAVTIAADALLAETNC